MGRDVAPVAVLLRRLLLLREEGRRAAHGGLRCGRRWPGPGCSVSRLVTVAIFGGGACDFFLGQTRDSPTGRRRNSLRHASGGWRGYGRQAFMTTTTGGPASPPPSSPPSRRAACSTLYRRTPPRSPATGRKSRRHHRRLLACKGNIQAHRETRKRLLQQATCRERWGDREQPVRQRGVVEAACVYIREARQLMRGFHTAEATREAEVSAPVESSLSASCRGARDRFAQQPSCSETVSTDSRVNASSPSASSCVAVSCSSAGP